MIAFSAIINNFILVMLVIIALWLAIFLASGIVLWRPLSLLYFCLLSPSLSIYRGPSLFF